MEDNIRNNMGCCHYRKVWETKNQTIDYHYCCCFSVHVPVMCSLTCIAADLTSAWCMCVCVCARVCVCVWLAAAGFYTTEDQGEEADSMLGYLVCLLLP